VGGALTRGLCRFNVCVCFVCVQEAAWAVHSREACADLMCVCFVCACKKLRERCAHEGPEHFLCVSVCICVFCGCV